MESDTVFWAAVLGTLFAQILAVLFVVLVQKGRLWYVREKIRRANEKEMRRRMANGTAPTREDINSDLRVIGTLIGTTPSIPAPSPYSFPGVINRQKLPDGTTLYVIRETSEQPGTCPCCHLPMVGKPEEPDKK